MMLLANWPQIVLLLWYTYAVINAGLKDGTPSPVYNAVRSLFSIVLEIFLVAMGGFFHVITIAQIIIILVMFSGLVISSSKHGEESGNYSGCTYFIMLLIMLGIYTWGGFFHCFGIH